MSCDILMMIMIRTITFSCSVSFVLVFAFLFSPFLQSQIWDATPISKNAIFRHPNEPHWSKLLRFCASNSGTQKKTHGISWHFLGISGWELPSPVDDHFGGKKPWNHLPRTHFWVEKNPCISPSQLVLLNKKNGFKVTELGVTVTWKWILLSKPSTKGKGEHFIPYFLDDLYKWTQEGSGNLEFREEQEVSRSGNVASRVQPEEVPGKNFPPCQKWLPKRRFQVSDIWVGKNVSIIQIHPVCV